MEQYPRWNPDDSLEGPGFWLYVATLMLEFPGMVARFVIAFVFGWLLFSPLWVIVLLVGVLYVQAGEPAREAIRTENLVWFMWRLNIFLALLAAFANVLLSLATVTGLLIKYFTGGFLTRIKLGARPPSQREWEQVLAAIERIVSSAPEELRRQIVAPTDWYVIDDPLPNGFVVGSTLYLTRELIRSSHLAAVMAHEYGHLNSTDGRMTLALNRFQLPLGSLFTLWRTQQARRAAQSDKPLVEQAFDDLGRSTAITLGCAAIIFLVLMALSVGGLGLLLLNPLWTWYWRQREYRADNFAAQCGFGGELVEFLEKYQYFDVATPFFMAEHPYTELRIDALQAYEQQRILRSTPVRGMPAAGWVLLGVVALVGVWFAAPNRDYDAPGLISSAVGARATSVAQAEFMRDQRATGTALAIAQEATGTAFAIAQEETGTAVAIEEAATGTAYFIESTATAEALFFEREATVTAMAREAISATVVAGRMASSAKFRVPTQTATATPTSTPYAVGVAGTIHATTVGLRTGPGLEYQEIVKYVSVGDFVIAVTRTSGGSWVLVELEDGTQGWIQEVSADWEESIQSLPTPLPTPTSTATHTPTVTPTGTDTPVATATSTATTTPIPTTTPEPLVCNIQTDQRILDLWGQQLGCPTRSQTTIALGAEQSMAGGHLFWRQDTDDLYAIGDRNKETGAEAFSGVWQRYRPLSTSAVPCLVTIKPPPNTPPMVKGFSWWWCAQGGGPGGPLGWPLQVEVEQRNVFTYQEFEGGFIWRGSDSKVYAMFNNQTFVATRF